VDITLESSMGRVIFEHVDPSQSQDCIQSG
jgi:hypothetical protein